MQSPILVHIVTFNNEDVISKCLSAVLAQKDFTRAQNLFIHVTDNASTDKTVETVSEEFFSSVKITQNEQNIGFAAGHNHGFWLTQKLGAEFILVLNPDVALDEIFLSEMLAATQKYPEVDLFTPKILRADKDLGPVAPSRFDATGMILTSSLRHFDRGSDQVDRGQYDQEEIVFGGTGAALLVRVAALSKLSLQGSNYDDDALKVYPALSENKEERLPIFDEAFFAYREDAELAWRALNLGIKTLYVPTAIAFHRRTVLSSNRTSLPQDYNLWSVRNRFLMQLVNFKLPRDSIKFLPGFVARNLLVLIGVFTIERSSLPALRDVKLLWRRALERRKILLETPHA